MPSWFARNFLMKMAIWARGHISYHEKPKLNGNKCIRILKKLDLGASLKILL